jgi:outer membrane usher protein
MPWFRPLFGARVLFAVFIALGIDLNVDGARAAPNQKNLQLEVVINNIPANSIGSFVLFDDGRIAANQSELDELGLKTDQHREANELVPLDDLPAVQYRYDEHTQKIFITVDDTRRKVREYDFKNNSSGYPRAQAGYGTVLNYNLLSATGNFYDPRPFSFNGASLTLDGRAFSPYGALNQSAIFLTPQNGRAEALRLDTTYRYSDQDSLITYRVGDAITGGLPWTRPIRIGGIQAQRNFSLRPDLITAPLPALGGSAAVPSTVDVYVNNIKTFSQDVGSGPFSLTNVPMVSGGGDARIVIRDASGHETITTMPFYSSPSMLAPGLISFSLESGLPRMAYGTVADTYVDVPIVAGTLRGGIFDGLTLETHVEFGDGLINAGAGAVATTGNFGVVSVAISGSRLAGSAGLQGFLSYETKLFGLSINASLQHTLGSYDDLASATARNQPILPVGLQNSFNFFPYTTPTGITNPTSKQLWFDARPPLEFDRITVGAPLPFDTKASLSASFIHLRDTIGNNSNILTASWSRALPNNATVYATAFTDIGGQRNSGIFVGLSVPIGGSASASVSVSSGRGGTTVNADAVQPLDLKPGSVGWILRDSEGANANRQASLSYRSEFARIQAGAIQSARNAGGLLEIEGAVATMGGGMFFANRIDDAFAVVSAGAPGVPVFHDNRPIGVTNAQGLILIPSLRSYDKNKITIDPSNLPVDADIGTTRDVVAPADFSGVLVDFRVRTDTSSALVVFAQPDGSYVAAGSSGKSDRGEEFIIGYDGQAFMKNLAPHNAVEIETSKGACRAQFSYSPRAGVQVLISPVVCGRSVDNEMGANLRPTLR